MFCPHCGKDLGSLTSDGVTYSPEKCSLCGGKGEDDFHRNCKACNGKGSFLVAQPAKECGKCEGEGEDSFGRLCKVCNGSGWAHAK